MDFHIAIDIAAPPDVVWPIMADVERWSEWTASITKVRRLDKGKFAVGSRAAVRQPRLPPAIWTVTSLEPGRSFAWTSGAPGMRVVGTHSVERTPSGTRALLSLHFSGVFGGLLARLTRDINHQYLSLEANGLKRRSESSAGVS